MQVGISQQCFLTEDNEGFFKYTIFRTSFTISQTYNSPCVRSYFKRLQPLFTRTCGPLLCGTPRQRTHACLWYEQQEDHNFAWLAAVDDAAVAAGAAVRSLASWSTTWRRVLLVSGALCTPRLADAVVCRAGLSLFLLCHVSQNTCEETASCSGICGCHPCRHAMLHSRHCFKTSAASGIEPQHRPRRSTGQRSRRYWGTCMRFAVAFLLLHLLGPLRIDDSLFSVGSLRV